MTQEAYSWLLSQSGITYSEEVRRFVILSFCGARP